MNMIGSLYCLQNQKNIQCHYNTYLLFYHTFSSIIHLFPLFIFTTYLFYWVDRPWWKSWPISLVVPVRLSRDSVASGHGSAGISVAKTIPTNWIFTNSCSCDVRMEGPIKLENWSRKFCNFRLRTKRFQPECSKGWALPLHDLKKAHSTDILVLTGDSNSQTGYLGRHDDRFGDQWLPNGRRSSNGNYLLQFYKNHNLFLTSIDTLSNHNWCTTWRPLVCNPSLDINWLHRDHLPIEWLCLGISFLLKHLFEFKSQFGVRHACLAF